MPSWTDATAQLCRAGRGLLRHPWLALGGLLLLFAAYVAALYPSTPAIGDMRRTKAEAPTVVLSADGKELALFKRGTRDWVKLSDMSPHVLDALIATEDHRFYQHYGIDPQRTVSSVLLTLTGSRQGGSTNTQQLARNFYPEEIGNAVTPNRKIREAITALKLESVYSKDEILETYLNTVPFLYNAYGIDMAARTYFDKPASALDVLESATLVGMLKATHYYTPLLNPPRARRRRNTVLGQMRKHGKLDQAAYTTLSQQPLGLSFEPLGEGQGPAPHFTQRLRRWLVEWADRTGHNIYADGMVVHTTIDSRLQAAANQAVERQTERLQALADAQWGPSTGWKTRKDLLQQLLRDGAAYKASRAAGRSDAEALQPLLADAKVIQALRQEKGQLQAGFMAIDPANGQVRAWVGSRDFELDKFDHVQQARRQPGSTFKPFVYGAALELGLSPERSYIDQPVEIALDSGQVWRPSDAGEPTGLEMSLRDGLALSKNTITAQVMQQVGPARVAQLAYAMGVRQSKLDPVLSLALGTSPVTLKEMVSAYGTLANGGSFIEPVLVTHIENRKGQLLERFAPVPGQRALPGATALTLLDMLRGVVDRGTGTAIRNKFGITADVAGKTGTTQDNTDAWFILMHPQLVAGAWVGYNDNRVTMRSDWGQGAGSALPIVGDFFQQALAARLLDAELRFASPPAPVAPEPVLAPPDVPTEAASAVKAETEPRP